MPHHGGGVEPPGHSLDCLVGLEAGEARGCHSHRRWGRGGGGLAQGLGIRLFAFGGAHWPLATAHSDPLWVRTCFGWVNGALDDLSCLTTPGVGCPVAVARAIDRVHPDAHSESMSGLPTPALTCARWGVHLQDNFPDRGIMLKHHQRSCMGLTVPLAGHMFIVVIKTAAAFNAFNGLTTIPFAEVGGEQDHQHRPADVADAAGPRILPFAFVGPGSSNPHRIGRNTGQEAAGRCRASSLRPSSPML